MDHLEDMLARYPALADLRDQIAKAAEIIVACYNAKGKVLACGNGGSAADSEHIIGELMKGFVLRRPVPNDDAEKLRAAGFEDWRKLAKNLQSGIPAVSLTGHVSLSTAILNDNDPFMTFAQQAYALGQPGDVLIGMSTSGNSRNVINALKVARAFGLSTIGFTGGSPCAMDGLCDAIIKVPSTETFKIQEYHLPVYHVICLMVEEEVFGPE